MEQVNGVGAKIMLSYKQALEKILKHSFTLKAKLLALRTALGLVVAKDIFSQEPFPSFDNSAVDGYAISVPKGSDPFGPLKIQGEVRAGEILKQGLKPGHAVRIFTGAPVPKGTQAVVMQEHTERMNGHITLLKLLKSNDNIRFRGEDFQSGTILVKKGTLLGPTHLALLAAVGYKKVPVYPPVKISILTTGSELLKAGEKLKPGKIHDSNSVLLKTMVKQVGGVVVSCSRVGDDPREIRSAVRRGFKSDLFIISGGVSVGAYDFVKEVLRDEGVREIFWKVDIKPGKPLFFGEKNRTLVFGLPGNPVSAFVTFEEFVKPALFKMMGKNHEREKEKIEGSLTKPFQNGSRLHFVRVHYAKGKRGYAVTPLKGQGSHMIGSLAASNGILKVEPNRLLRKKERVFVKII